MKRLHLLPAGWLLRHLPLLLLLLFLQTSTAAADSSLVATGSLWEYLDGGQDPGPLWYGQFGTDARWRSSLSPFGYGDDGERTILTFGPDRGNRAIAYYFRRRFNVADTSGFRSLQLRLKRDDGAVLYLNGVELLRSNMPAGTIGRTTPALTFVEGRAEDLYQIYNIDKRLLRLGSNLIAAEVHQNSATSTDVAFDLTLALLDDTLALTPIAAAPAVDCDANRSDHISCFTSIPYGAPRDTFVYPSRTHTFQRLVTSGRERYTGTTMPIPEGNDFTGYVARDGSSREGYLSINHEITPGGITIADLQFDLSRYLWNVRRLDSVSFAEVVRTDRNCSGTVTPWGTVISAEESVAPGDSNSDGYEDVGWMVEIDPATRRLRDYNGDGRGDKLWALGRMIHENVAIAADRITVYQGEDGGTACLYKFVAARAGRLDSGALYVLRRDSLQPSTGRWIRVPNTTKAERNAVATTASGLGGTSWGRIEDVEIGPDGKIYFAETRSGTVYRLRDDGATVSALEAWVTNQVYPVVTEAGVVNAEWGFGADNLTFDDLGNLYVLQDGWWNHVWVVRPDHTNAAPHVEILISSPRGSEPTGMTFSPDYRFLFMSFMHPSPFNTEAQRDAADSAVVFNASTTFVLARREYLGENAFPPIVDLGDTLNVCEQAGFVELHYSSSDAFHRWSDGSTDTVLRVTSPGRYWIAVTGNNGLVTRDTVDVRFVPSTPLDLGPDRTICEGSSYTFSGLPAGVTYHWENGSTVPQRTITAGGIYHLRLLDSNGCYSYDTVQVTVAPRPRPDLGTARRLCPGGTLTLDAGAGFSAYRWSSGATTQTITIDRPGTYSVSVTSVAGCIGADTIVVTPIPAATLGNDQSICPGASLTITPGEGYDSYLWSTGATTPLVDITSAGRYSVLVTKDGCEMRDTIEVALRDTPPVDLGADTTICLDCEMMLDAGAGFVSYLWSTGERSRTIRVRSTGIYKVTATHANGCWREDEIAIIRGPVTGVEESRADGAVSVGIYPNPFSSDVTVTITLARRSAVLAEVYDPAGRLVATLAEGDLVAGRHDLRFDASRIGGGEGVYILRLTVDGERSNHTIVRR